MSTAGVLLDVDGTLVDSNYLHTIAWSRALRDRGEWAPMNALHRLVGMGGDQLTERILGEVDELASERWQVHYEELIGEVRTFPGATELVRSLHDAGLSVVLASSSPPDHVERMVEVLDVSDALSAVTTADDGASSKPAPDIFEAALEVGGLDPERAVVVGDSIWDIRAARAAGLGTIAVETGGFSRHELTEEGAAAVFRDVEELGRRWRTSLIGLLVR